jgi:iron(III) transport system ATP-binding protein
VSTVRISGVVAGYGQENVLDGVDLVLEEGSLTAVLGASGCGKSTVLRTVAGLLPVRGGSVEIGGRLVAGRGVHVPPERRRVGLVPQDAALFPHRDVVSNVGFGLRRNPHRRERVAELVRLVGLQGLERRMPYELSGGQRHRVALARALAPRPAVLLLDEPFAALDANLRAELRAEVRDVLRAAGTTALLVTHDQTEALSMADQVAVMAQGRIAQAGTPQEVYWRPVSPTVAAFVGDAVLLPGRWRAGSVRCALGVVAATGAPAGPDGSRVQVLLRPEQIAVRPLTPGVDGGSGDLGRDGYPAPVAVVRAVDFYGHDAELELDLLGGFARLAGAVGLPGGVEPSERAVLDDGVRLRARTSSDSLPARGTLVRLEVVGGAVVYRDHDAAGQSDEAAAPSPAEQGRGRRRP